MKNLKDSQLTEAIPPKFGNVQKRSCYEMRPRLMNFVEFQNSFQFNRKSFVRELVPACLLEKLGKTHLERETFNNWPQIDPGARKTFSIGKSNCDLH